MSEGCISVGAGEDDGRPIVTLVVGTHYAILTPHQARALADVLEDRASAAEDGADALRADADARRPS